MRRVSKLRNIKDLREPEKTSVSATQSMSAPEPTTPAASQASTEALDYSRLLSRFKSAFGDADDFSSREIRLGDPPGLQAAILYIQGISDQTHQSASILESTMLLARMADPPLPDDGRATLELIERRYLSYSAVRRSPDFTEAANAILSGDTVFLVDQAPYMLILDTKGWARRGVEEPATEAVIRGPRDGFIETMRVNVAHIRRRLKTTRLAVKEVSLGKRTKTDISLVYMADIADPGLVDSIVQTIDSVDIDGVVSSGQLEQLLNPRPLALFPLIERTERPDKVAASILEGRVAIVVDNSPFVLIVPTSVWSFFQASEDYYESPVLGTLLRLLRLGSALIATMGTAFYVAVVLFHQEVIPFALMLRIVATHEGLPLGTLPTALLMEAVIEILREAGVRLPRPVGSAISIVGAIIIGEAAVSAGFVPPGMVIVVSLATIAGFTIPAYNMAVGLRLTRLGIIVMAGIFGLYGLGMAAMVVICHAMSLTSFGLAYADPLGEGRVFELEDGPAVFLRRARKPIRPVWASGDVWWESEPWDDDKKRRGPN